jgi:hypothetical protein
VLASCCGVLYAVAEPGFFYTAAIESLLLGVPIVFFEDGLLNTLMPLQSPGRARNVDDAHRLCRRLAEGDEELAREMIGSQASLRASLLPEVVEPAFETAFAALLSRASIATRWRTPQEAMVRKIIAQLLTAIVRKDDGQENSVDRLLKTVEYGVLGERPDLKAIRAAQERLRRTQRLDEVLRDFLDIDGLVNRDKKSVLFKWLFPLDQLISARKSERLERAARE